MIHRVKFSEAVQGSQLRYWIVILMACIFALQWTLTLMPHVLIIRNIAYAIGALLGIYMIIKNYDLLLQKKAMPIWVILLLFLWMLAHLLLIGSNHELQMEEFRSLWKRAALGSIFALGFGIAILRLEQMGDSTANVTISRAWKIIVAGLCGPTIIYFIKYLASNLLPIYGINPPEYLTLYYRPEPFYIPKIAYVFYCLPLLSLALGMLVRNLIRYPNKRIETTWFWVAIIIAVMAVFICENIKNGILYSLMLIIIFACAILKNRTYSFTRVNWAILGFVFFVACVFGVFNLKSNPSWGTLVADAQVANHIAPDEVWKSSEFVYPNNKYGYAVSPTNFDRIFYAKMGFDLLKNNPLGYGLVHSSFGHLAKEHWPNAPLIQSHSGWLDLALGVGIPGVFLLLIAAVLAMKNALHSAEPWPTFGVWVLGSILLLYVTTEVAQKNYVDTLVWLIVLVGSLSLNSVNSKDIGRANNTQLRAKK